MTLSIPRGALLLVCLAVAAGCDSGSSPDAGPASSGHGDAASIEFLNTDLSVGYVGMETCKSCHLGLYTTYKETGMGRAFYPLTADIVVEDFTDDNEFVVQTSGVHYRMYEKDGRFYQRQFILDSQGRESAVEERELIYVVGSNNHSRSYITMVDDKWFQAPACWYPQGERWDLCPGYEFGNEHFSREIQTACLTCHNGHMEPVEGVRNAFHEPIPHGIGCERCHGPGELHVARWDDGTETATGEPDPTIVNPRRLSVERRNEVCFQCHLGDARATSRVMRDGVDPENYRPGLRMEDYFIPFRYEEETEWDFGLSSQADRMVVSKCYTESGGKLECLTCHNPHITVYHEDRAPDHFRKKCLSCHQVDSCSASMDTRGTTTPADDCVQCHMRTAEPDDQRYTTFTDHWIRRDIDLKERDHREDFWPEPFFPEQLARLPEGEQHYYRGRASYLLAQDAPRIRYAEMWADAEREFRAALDAGFDNGSVWFFLGKTLGYEGRKQDALAAYEKAVAHDPDYTDAVFALGKTKAELGDWQGATEVFAGMVEKDPNNTMALSEFGRALFQLRQFDQALAAFQQAIGREPWDHTLQVNLGMALAAKGQMPAAADVGDRAVRLNPEKLNGWMLYMNAMREAGRLEEALEGQHRVRQLQENPPQQNSQHGP